MPLQQMLYREAYRMLGDSFEAEDAVQNLYVRLWEQKEQKIIENIIQIERNSRVLSAMDFLPPYVGNGADG